MPKEAPPDVLVAQVTSVRPLASMLRPLAFNSKAVVEIQAGGIKITVEQGSSIQAHAYLHSSTFSLYLFTPPITEEDNDDALSQSSSDSDAPRPTEQIYTFGISLTAFMECLNIFGNAGAVGGPTFSGGGGGDRAEKDSGSKWKKQGRVGEEREERQERAAAHDNGKSTSMRMSYAGEGEPLVLLLEEGGTVTRCELTTYEPDLLMDLPFDDESKVQKVIMKSEWLRDAFAEIDPSSEKLTITFSPADHSPTQGKRWGVHTGEGNDGQQEPGIPNFRLESHGAFGSSEMDYPNDRDVLELFECASVVQNSYRFSHIQLTTKALNASTKTSIRTAEDGLISFQFMIPMGKADVCGFVEFLCIPLDDEY